MGNAAVFYPACFLAGFLLCFPFGAASLEMLRLSLSGRPRLAFSVAAGAALASSSWALLSFFGIRTLTRRLQAERIDAFLFGAAALLVGWLSWRAFRDSRAPAAEGSRPPAAASGMIAHAVKGVLLGLLNPQTIASWVLVLAMLKKAGLRIPAGGPSWLLFFLAVTAGYGLFFLLVIRLSQRLACLREASSRSRLMGAVAVLLLCLALLFAAAALRASLR
jgi:threonine/homoserine/homoserine lactone efflux protein